MNVLSADSKRALNILRLVTEQVEELEAAKLTILELRETNKQLRDELDLLAIESANCPHKLPCQINHLNDASHDAGHSPQP